VDPLFGTVQMGIVHHTVTANDYGPEDSAAIVLGIARYHRDHNGWNDIGYNFLVDKYGQVFEGRAGGVDQAIVGAQAQGYNTISTGVSCLGDYTSTSLPDAAFEALAQLLAWKLTLHGAPVLGEITVTSTGGPENRYAAGRLVTLQRISGHRDGDATACPGATLYAQLPDLRTRTAAIAATLVTDALTIATPATSVKAPATVALSGALRFADGTVAASRPLTIEYQGKPGDPWNVATTALTAADGTWTATVSPGGSCRVRAVFAGDGVHGALSSVPLSIEVIPRVTVAVSHATVRSAGRIHLSGTIGPSWPRRLTLTLERHTRSGTVLVQRKRIRVRNGAYRTYVRLWRRGRYRLTIDAAGGVKRRKLRRG
jgi:hypothetical protein